MGSTSDSQDLLIGVISDTHGVLDPKAYNALADCDHIIHAGDICSPEVLKELRTLAPVTAVLGNNDFDEYGDDVKGFANVSLGGVRFLVAHYPQDVQLGAFGTRALSPGDPIPDVCIHGHTHVPRLEWGPEARPASFIMNPGAAFRPRGGSPRSIGKIQIHEGRVGSAWIEDLDGHTLFSLGS